MIGGYWLRTERNWYLKEANTWSVLEGRWVSVWWHQHFHWICQTSRVTELKEKIFKVTLNLQAEPLLLQTGWRQWQSLSPPGGSILKLHQDVLIETNRKKDLRESCCSLSTSSTFLCSVTVFEFSSQTTVSLHRMKCFIHFLNGNMFCVDQEFSRWTLKSENWHFKNKTFSLTLC